MWISHRSIAFECSTAVCQKIEPPLALPFIRREIATMVEPALRILSRNGEQGLSNGFLKGLSGSGSCSSQRCFELGERFFDRREVRRIARQEEHLTPFRFDGEPHSCSFVSMEIIHHHNLTGLQAGSQNLFDIDLKGDGIGRSLQDHGCSHARKGESGDQRGILATVAWNASPGPLPFWRTGIQGGQGNIGAALIDKDELFSRKLAGLCSPGAALLLVALTGTQ